ncbi:GntR family transcriptional regulator [Planktomarina sp.]|uniref:GntR family transcriptional regulator n=1 Tax=Planktomarina sp. TaxID=2024851 RepID=UPI00288F0B53|nr:GntR family transcriptional regulator [Planktomarina sp.]
MFKNAKPIQKDKLHDQVYDRLCMLLREGEFTPGEAVRVAHISEAFGVSAMPVREALTRLLAIGVVANVSGRSVGVPALGYEELTDLRDVRLEVEALAVRWAVRNRDDNFVAELDALLERLEASERSSNVRGYVKANYEFHLRLYQQSQSSVLIGIIDTLWLRVSPHLYRLEREDHYKVSNSHHREIVHCIQKGDAKGASDALISDITDAYEGLVQSILDTKTTL